MNLNYWLYRARYLAARHLRLKAPVDVSLELSSHCQLSCPYCYHADKSSLPFPQKHMSWDTAAIILGQAALAGVNSVKFNWRGEGTLNPFYYEIVALAKALSHGSTFIDLICNTNAQYTKASVTEALWLMDTVKFSFDSFDKDVYLHQRKGANYELALDNIDEYHAMKDNKARMVIQAVRTSLNINEDILSIAKKRWPNAEVSIRNVVPDRAQDMPSEMKIDDKNGSRIPCKQAWSRLIFAANGDATICCPDTKMVINLGNIEEMSLVDIFNSNKAKKIRRSLLNGSAFNFDPCKTCSSFESFKGYKPNRKS